MPKGYLIAFEGIDGTGKSTQIRMLGDRLDHSGFDVVITREPTDGTYGKKIRSLFASRDRITPEEELQLFMDDRREHVRDLIVPSLERGAVVLTDRYYFSTAAYQGAVGYDPQEILDANEVFAPVPDMVVILTLSPDESVRRIREIRGEELNDFEQIDALKAVAAVFDSFHMKYIERVDGSLAPDEVHEIIAGLVSGKLGDNTVADDMAPSSRNGSE